MKITEVLENAYRELWPYYLIETEDNTLYVIINNKVSRANNNIENIYYESFLHGKPSIDHWNFLLKRIRWAQHQNTINFIDIDKIDIEYEFKVEAIYKDGVKVYPKKTN